MDYPRHKMHTKCLKGRHVINRRHGLRLHNLLQQSVFVCILDQIFGKDGTQKRVAGTVPGVVGESVHTG